MISPLWWAADVRAATALRSPESKTESLVKTTRKMTETTRTNEGDVSLEGDASLDSDAAERQRRQRKADRELLAEAGLGKMRRVRNGVPLTP